jgi:hypothetical protein
MTKQEKLAAFLDAQIAFPRVTGPYWHASAYPYRYLAQQRPTAEQLAEELLGFAEFRALQLGTWLGTADGQVIAEAVEMLAPPLYREDAELLVAALNYAAELQWREGQKIAGRVALGAIGAALLVGVAIGSSGGAPGPSA